MSRFLLGLLAGLLGTVLTLLLTVRFLPDLLVVDNVPAPADAIFVLDGDSDGSRIRAAIRLYDAGLAPLLVHINGKSRKPDYVTARLCPDCGLDRKSLVVLENSADTRTDADIALAYCRASGLRRILVVTSPYHTRRAQFIFNDIFAGSGTVPTILSSNDFERFVPPDGRWWEDRRTLENVWLETGKSLYWELTPFQEFQGEGERLKESEKGR